MDKMHKVMSEFKAGTLHSGSKKGPKVSTRAQAVAIGMSEAKKATHNKRLTPKRTMATSSKHKAKPSSKYGFGYKEAM